MKIISRDTYKLIPALIIIIIASLGLLFIIDIIIDRSKETIDTIAIVLFLSWFIIIPLTLLIPMFRSIELHNDKLLINYLFGLVTRGHVYSQLKLSSYKHQRGNGIVIESSTGQQLTFGEKEYRNYEEVRKILESKIERTKKIDLKYISTPLLTMLVLFGLSLVFVIFKIKG